MRLQKFLARAGVASRRGSENLMTAGRVCVNGQVVTELGSKVDPLVDVVEVDGCVVELGSAPTTLLLNKPAGVITTMKAQSERAIVADLVPCDRFPGLFPIGRLDADTTGLLLFSTDGELGNGLLHPRHHVEKTYIACIEGTLSNGQLEQLRAGVELEEGVTLPAKVELLEAGQTKRWMSFFVDAHPELAKRLRGQVSRNLSVVSMTIREGRYHQVKRMFECVSHPVVALHRASFGPLTLGDEQLGTWRVLSNDEVSKLHEAVGS